ncbi:MAG: PEP-CTERM sorting domain-containing protein [Pirellulaceae bacterium]|nr:PEP-CTERM sorting domain-containing protein [Pirellulaceae bacterium]
MNKPFLWLSSVVLGYSLLAAPASAGVVAYYRFENSGSLGDDQTANHPGTPTNGPTASSSVGQNPVKRTGAANIGSMNLDFTAPADHLEIAHHADLSFGLNPWTIEAYVSFDSVPSTSTGGMYIAQKKASGVTDNFTDYAFLISGNRGGIGAGISYYDNGSYSATGRNLHVEFGDGSQIVAFRSNLNVPTSGWAHISAAFDGSQTVRFTLDTDLTDNVIGAIETIVAGSSFTTSTNTGTLIIGAKKNNAGAIAQAFDGLLDEVRISNNMVWHTNLLAVPEPSSALLAVCGIGGLLARRRRR